MNNNNPVDKPYPGPRPFTLAEKNIFFGRDRELFELHSLIIAHRVVVLYARSGAGKTSLLQAGLIPLLAKEGFEILPIARVRGLIQGDIDTSKLESVFVFNTLLCWVEYNVESVSLASQTISGFLKQREHFIDPENFPQPRVAIFDQFEELFSFYEEYWNKREGFFEDIANALNEDPLLRVMFVLRDDYLARLIKYAELIPGRLRTQYQLERLSPEAAALAIEKPSGKAGRSFAEGVVGSLIQQLLTLQTPAGIAETARIAGQYVEPVQLQVVCQRLWENLPESVRMITVDHVQKFADVDTALTDFYHDALRVTKKEAGVLGEYYLRRWFSEKLITSANTRGTVFRGTKKTEGIPNRAVDELVNQHIIRGEARAGAQWYELTHDRLIEPIQKSNSPWFRRARTIQLSAIFVLLCAVIGSVYVWLDYRDLRKNTEDVMKGKGPSAKQKFDHVASYLLWNRTGSKRFEILKDLLEEYKDSLPPDYGVDRSGLGLITLPEYKDNWPLTLRYSSARREGDKDFEYLFTKSWYDIAKFLNETWGLPTPLKLELISDPSYPKELIELTGHQIEPLRIDSIPAREQDAFFTSANLSIPGQEFLERFESEWTRIPQIKHGGPWWIVPRWSLPAWKASGVRATDGSGLAALLLAINLQKNPDRLLTPEAVELLLSNVGKRYPEIVGEARAVRGERLPSDLQEFVRKERALTELPTLLNILANYPKGSAIEIVDSVVSDLDSPTANLPKLLRGPYTAQRLVAKPKAIHKAYEDAAQWLPSIEPEIRIYLGRNLDSAWITEDGSLTSEFLEARNSIEETVLRRFGVAIPQPQVRGAIWDPDIPESAFRIEMLNQVKGSPDAAPVVVDRNDALGRFSASLLFRSESYRVHFLNADRVSAVLNKVDTGLRSWLKTRYSLTDLKLILQAVVNPTDAELDERLMSLDIGEEDKQFTSPPENSIRYPAWLLGSLLFWSKIHDMRSLPVMSADLRETQKARLTRHKPVNSENEGIAMLVRSGIRALRAGRYAEAEAAFSDVVKSDKRVAVSTFLTLYLLELRPLLIRNLLKSCKDLEFQWLGVEQRVDLEDLVREKDFDKSTGIAIARHLRLCLLANYPSWYRQKWNAMAMDLALRYGTPSDWSPEEATWFGKKLLTWYDPLSDDKSMAQHGFAFLKTGLAGLKPEDAVNRLYEVIEKCGQPGPNRWFWDILPTLAESSRDPGIVIEIAWQLAHREVQADVQRALLLVNQVQEQLQEEFPEEKQDLLYSVDLTRGVALSQLSRFGDQAGMREAETTFLRLRAYSELAGLRRRENRLDEAISLLDSAMESRPNDPNLYARKLSVRLLDGDGDAVSQLAHEALDKLKIDREGFGFVASLGLLITETGAWEQTARQFLATNHPYVPYIAMMLSSRMMGKGKEEAREVIARRWARARPATWQARLREGDETVWREMLIGYYLEDVLHEDIFGDLEDEARFANSDLRHIPMPRLALLCEAYFYDALLAEARGNSSQMISSLEKVLQTNYSDYFEYAMAKFLLSRSGMYKL